jgi:hypothetical protein
MTTGTPAQSRLQWFDEHTLCVSNENGLNCKDTLVLLACVSAGDELALELENGPSSFEWSSLDLVLSRTPTLIHDPISKHYEVTLALTIDGWDYEVILSPTRTVWLSSWEADWTNPTRVRFQLLGEAPASLCEQRVGRILWPEVVTTVGSTPVDAPSPAWVMIGIGDLSDGWTLREIQAESTGIIETWAVTPLMRGGQLGWHVDVTFANYGGARADYRLSLEAGQDFVPPPEQAVSLDVLENTVLGFDLWAAALMESPPPLQIPGGSCTLTLSSDTGRQYDQREVVLEEPPPSPGTR